MSPRPPARKRRIDSRAMTRYFQAHMASLQRSDRPFLEALKHGFLVVDGAMGTQLYERGVLYSTCFEDLNLARPELVTKVHEDYVRAGANVIESNTFGANALRLE